MTDSACSKSRCSTCTKIKGCGWCNGPNAVAVGDCVLDTNTANCSAALVVESDQCPSVGADVIIKNITGMVGAMLAVAIFLNVCNRVSNRRKSKKLQNSIFTLPVYVYSASTRDRAKAARRARASLQGAPRDIELAGSDPSSSLSSLSLSASSPAVAAAGPASPASDSSLEDGDTAAVVTCTICLASYEEEELIKVLPCGHDFHSGCLDSWLERKAVCPLCKEPAFPNPRDGNWTDERSAQIPDPGVPTAAPPQLLRSESNSPDQLRDFPLDIGIRSGAVVGEAPLAAASAPPTPTPPLPPESRAIVIDVCSYVGADGTREREALAAATGGLRSRSSVERAGGILEGDKEVDLQAKADTGGDAANGIARAEERAAVDGAPIATTVVDGASDVGATTASIGGDDQGRNSITSVSSGYRTRHGAASPKGVAWPRETVGGGHREASVDQL
ncbi:unnamed protein product [Scytosiphon promiscuus]